MAWIVIASSAVIAWIVWTAISIHGNLRIARTIGLPVIISPVNGLNPLWIMTYRSLSVLRALQFLPFGLGTFARCTRIGWQFDENYALHEELGDAFIIVTPSTNEVVLANPDAVTEVLKHRKEFIKPAIIFKQLEIFGPSVATVNGDTWQRHRKVTAPSFNERVNDSVWNEAIQQARDMLHAWLQRSQLGTKETVGDTAVLALHVLTVAGFGLRNSYGDDVQRSQSGFTLSYRDALSLVLRNVVLLFVVPRRVLTFSFIPKRLRDLGQATLDFQKYMEELLARERRLIRNREPGQRNLISALVRASEEAAELGESVSIRGLQDEEIFGNMFLYNLAGYETTANTIAYAIVLLAAYPQVQEWIAEEIEAVLGSQEKSETWTYEAAFPLLRRCLAVMFETLRLYGSFGFIPKTTGSRSQSLSLQKKNYDLPPNTYVTINTQALHTDPAHWNPNSLSWHPKRWIITPSNSNRQPSETMLKPSKGTFLPWADGPRACPGRRMAEVEFVAVMATLFHRHRVSPVLLHGETAESAKSRLLHMVDDSAISAVTLQMQHPRNVALVWTKDRKVY